MVERISVGLEQYDSKFKHGISVGLKNTIVNLNIIK